MLVYRIYRQILSAESKIILRENRQTVNKYFGTEHCIIKPVFSKRVCMAIILS